MVRNFRLTFFQIFCISLFFLYAACGCGSKASPTALLSTEQSTNRLAYASPAFTTPSATFAPTATMTPTVTFTPSATPTPTFTPIPTLQIPLDVPIQSGIATSNENLSFSDAAVVNGNFLYQISRAYTISQIGNYQPKDGWTFLVFQGYLYNSGESSSWFFIQDFQLLWEGASEAHQASKTLMETYRNELRNSGEEFEYLGHNWQPLDRTPGHYLEVPANQRSRLLLVYDYPIGQNPITLSFGVENRTRVNVEFLLSSDPESQEPDVQEQYIVRTKVNGIPTYTIVDTQFSQPRYIGIRENAEEIPATAVRNCTSEVLTRQIEIRRERSWSESISRDFSINVFASGEYHPMPLAGAASSVLSLTSIPGFILSQLGKVTIYSDARVDYQNLIQQEIAESSSVMTTDTITLEQGKALVGVTWIQPIERDYIVTVRLGNQDFNYVNTVVGEEIVTRYDINDYDCQGETGIL